MILRSEAGTIVHTGDWKIDEEPIDGQLFDREFFEAMGKAAILRESVASRFPAIRKFNVKPNLRYHVGNLSSAQLFLLATAMRNSSCVTCEEYLYLVVAGTSPDKSAA